MILNSNPTNAQVKQNGGDAAGSKVTNRRNSSGCDNTMTNHNPVFIDEYRKLSSYLPYVTIPKTFQIAFHIFTGPGSYHDNKVDLAHLNLLFSFVHDWYLKNGVPSDTIAGVVDLPSTYINLELDNRIYFYDSTGLWKSCNTNGEIQYIQDHHPERLNYFPVLIDMGGCIQHTLAPYPAYLQTPTTRSLDDNQYVYMSAGAASGTIWAQAIVLGHELGHAFDLFHLYEPGCCHETCDSSSTDYLFDALGPHPTGNCWIEGNWNCDPYAAGNTCTNNIMGGAGGVNFSAYYFTPLQIAKMHRAFYIKTARRYVKDSPFDAPLPIVIHQNELWDFDIRVYQNIIVESGDTLTVTGKIAFPGGAAIIVKSGAQLVVDGGILTSSGSSKWEGIEAWRGSRQIQMKKAIAKRIVVLTNRAAIENAADYRKKSRLKRKAGMNY